MLHATEPVHMTTQQQPSAGPVLTILVEQRCKLLHKAVVHEPVSNSVSSMRLLTIHAAAPGAAAGSLLVPVRLCWQLLGLLRSMHPYAVCWAKLPRLMFIYSDLTLD